MFVVVLRQGLFCVALAVPELKQINQYICLCLLSSLKVCPTKPSSVFKIYLLA